MWPFGSYQDDAAGSTGAVDGRAGCIFQDGDGLDVIGVYQVDVSFHVVNQHQGGNGGTVTSVAVLYAQRVCATYLERFARAGGIAAAAYQQSRHGALQGVRGFRQGTVAQHVVHLYRGDGTGQVGLLLGAEAHDYHLVQLLGVFLEGDVQGLPLPGDGLFDVADVGDFQYCAGFDIGDAEFSVKVGYHTLGSTFNYYGCADDGFSVSVFHYALALAALLYNAGFSSGRSCL